ncbi:MAG: 23S rRNA (guanosine(2251)-2'-O)-methyltransferase RlmB [Acidobacteria bacterium]|nr:23S rRNA (guanosine(2251)-2'-O)-methyltransferase RlmB [Acidobacteriota bacterium]
MKIYGVNPVLEALRAGRVREVRVGGASGGRVADVVVLAGQLGVPVRQVSGEALERDSRRGVHQGVVAELDAAPRYSVADLVAAAAGPPLLVVLDGVEDPHNLGAVLRTADAAGVDGLVRQTRRSAALGGAAAKASAGAVVHVKIADVVNIARSVQDLKALGVWTVGLVADAATRYDAVDFTGPMAIVLGGEGAGLRRLVRERCDFLAAIPMHGRVDSLNVSVAAGVVLFEAVRQRAGAASGST